MKLSKSFNIFSVTFSNSTPGIELVLQGSSYGIDPAHEPKIYLDVAACKKAGIEITPKVVGKQINLELEYLPGSLFEIQEQTKDLNLLRVRDIAKETKLVFLGQCVGEKRPKNREDEEISMTLGTPSYGHFSPIVAPYFQLKVRLTPEEYAACRQELTYDATFAVKIVSITDRKENQ